MRARKYLWRRVRLFIPPINEPRRLMKDIRGRILAVGILQGVAAIFYGAFFLASITTYGYGLVASGNSSGGQFVTLSMWLLFKAVLSFSLFIGVLLDTDVTLTLGFFGCMGWHMQYVKDYTRRKKEELGGWPYPYFFNEARYGFFTMGKMLDFVWGVVGWSVLHALFAQSYSNLAGELRFYVTLMILVLAVTDVWVPCLMYAINWLVRKHKVMQVRMFRGGRIELGGGAINLNWWCLVSCGVVHQIAMIFFCYTL